MKFQIYLSEGQYRWRLVASNGEPIASGEAYHNKADCLHAIELIRGTSSATPVVEEESALEMFARSLAKQIGKA